MVVNSWVLALTEATAEAIALAEGLRLDPKLFLDTIQGTPTDSPYAHIKGAAMLARQFEPSFPVRAAAKDARLILEAAGDARVDMALTTAAQSHFAKALESGHADDDLAAVYLVHRPE
jgi:3-hydroxyisobutyrate dehydrogenase